MTDQSDAIAERIVAAREDGEPLCIVGGNSKRDLLGRHCDFAPLDISGHRGIIDYQPEELVITARAGTPVADIRDALAAQGQEMSFEPPLFGGRATLGGTLACNLSGPARPWRGSLRDMVLGIRLINGEGQQLGFGGQVMKNVAGYDVSRLQAGALGTLGVITEISLKVLPRPEQSLTLVYETSAAEAVRVMNQRAREPKPLTGALWVEGRLFIRLAGAGGAVEQTANAWGGDTVAEASAPWAAATEMSLPFFNATPQLWRLSVGSGTPLELDEARTMIDWGGALYWFRGEADAGELQRIAAAAGGHACLFRGGDRNGEVRQPMSAVERRLQERLKEAFDPGRILNRGRLYSWM